MTRPKKASPIGPVKGELICPTCGHTSEAIDGDWIAIETTRPGHQFRCPVCGARFGDRPTVSAPA